MKSPEIYFEERKIVQIQWNEQTKLLHQRQRKCIFSIKTISGEKIVTTDISQNRSRKKIQIKYLDLFWHLSFIFKGETTNRRCEYVLLLFGIIYFSRNFILFHLHFLIHITLSDVQVMYISKNSGSRKKWS